MPKLGKFNKGDKVRIRKGAVIYERDGKQRIAGKSYVVTVYRDQAAWLISPRMALYDRDYHGRLVQQGFSFKGIDEYEGTDSFDKPIIVLEQERVIWSGKDGWCETDLYGVELVERA